MNKYQEALDYLRRIGGDGYYKKQREKSFDVLQELVDKETPIQAIRTHQNHNLIVFLCPRCSKGHITGLPIDCDYCNGCGQKLDWSNEERGANYEENENTI